jgi:hypothetical protein
MATKKEAQQPKAAAAPFAGWRPVSDLWQSGAFPSEQSARWAIRRHKCALYQAQALVLYRGVLMYEPSRFKETVEQRELAASAQRAVR